MNIKARRVNPAQMKQKRIEELEEKLLIAKNALFSYCTMTAEEFKYDDGWEACDALGAIGE